MEAGETSDVVHGASVEEETNVDDPNSNVSKGMVEEVDRISALPDAILVRILSLLPTKYAVRTGLLSKRWHFLWTDVPNLSFVYKNLRGSPEELDDFFQFIDKTLLLHSSEKIHTFSLDFSYYFNNPQDYFVASPHMESRLSLWLRFATFRQVEDLHLELYTCRCGMNLEIPSFVYDYPLFTKLYTSGCDYPLPRGRPKVAWGFLKELTIAETDFEASGVLQMILSGTPLLEYFRLNHCWVTDIDTAPNRRLKTLVLDEALRGGIEPEVPVSIPTVTSLQILGDCYDTQYRLLNTSSLLEVTLDFEANYTIILDSQLDRVVALPACCAQVWPLLQSLKHVQKLTIGIWCIRVLSMLVSRAGYPPLSKNKCTCLTLATHFKTWDFLGVATLLCSSPCLEKLVVDGITRSFYYQFENINYPSEFKEFWSSPPESLYCWQRLLKTIKIVGLEPRGRYFDKDSVLEFIKFLLRSANVLEKLVISAPSTPTSESEAAGNMDNHDSDISQQLLSFPKSSTQAVVLFNS